MEYRETMKKFILYLGDWVMYSDNGHVNYKYGSASSELFETAQFIHLPKHVFQYIDIDLDWERSASLWMDEFQNQ